MPKGVEKIKEDVDEFEKMFYKYEKDGFELLEIMEFSFETGARLIEAVQKVQGISGKEEKEVVKSAVKQIYRKVNPDIPKIPEPFETRMENLFLEKTLDAFIDFVVNRYKERGLF